MKCPKGNKHCKVILSLKEKGHYICSGINSKPTKHKKDTIALCLKGKYVEEHKVEMTPVEALIVISVLSLSTSAEVSNGY